jgi:hypothetical protein
MIPGLNTKVIHAGVEYHVQTEDLGRQNPYVLTLVFRSGAIIAREKVNYREVLGDGAHEVQVKRFMDQQHQRIIQNIQAGQPQGSAASELAPHPPPPTEPAPPKPSLPPADKTLDQLITEYLQSRQAAKPR